jgi:hypothetical protein
MVLQQVKLQPDLKWEEARKLMLDWTKNSTIKVSIVTDYFIDTL